MGELKKRIEDKASYERPYIEISPENLDLVLNEANKEFPVDDIPNSTPDKEMLLRLVKLNRERLNWRLKWFGK